MATILLIEDDPSTREAIRALLEQDGHTVLEAGTGVEALTVAGMPPTSSLRVWAIHRNPAGLGTSWTPVPPA